MRGRRAVTGCFFGDGAVAEGTFHESLNLAALWRLPVLFICENNLYAMGTALERHQARTGIVSKAVAAGVAAEAVDGMDVLAVEEVTRRAADVVRRGDGPCLVEAQTYRFRAHSMYDPDLYRTKEEIERWKARDPIALFTAALRERSLLADADLVAIEAAVASEIASAIAEAETGPWESVADLLKDVHTPVDR
jgi:TPP-dependent pyruvate/acetoin dehydrogenase alpha subunit